MADVIEKCPSENELIKMGVVDIKSYKVWFVLQKKPLLNVDKVFIASDGLTRVDLGWLPHWMKKKIEHLSNVEQQDILTLKVEYQSLMSRAASYKRLAFGAKNGLHMTIRAKNRFNVLQSKATEALELFGKYYSIDEVYQIMVTEHKLPVTRELLKAFRKQHMAQIEEKRRLFSVSFTDVRLGHKRSRIEELCVMYNIFKLKMLDSKKEATARLLKDILKDIKEEVEGDVITINGSIDLNMAVTIENHIKKEALKHISLRQIIIGRVAAKNDTSPESLIARLSKSYYSGYTDMSDAEELEYEDVKYPSEEHYDFNVIESQAETKKIEAANEEIIRRQNLANLAKKGKRAAVKAKLKDLLKKRGDELAEGRLEIEKYQGKKMPLVKNTNKPPNHGGDR